MKGNVGHERPTSLAMLLPSLGLLIAVCIAYLPALRAGFVWDDFDALHENPLLRSVRGLWQIWTTNGLIPNESHYWPVLYTRYWVEYHLWELQPFGYHAVNVVLHAACSILLGALLKEMRVPGAWPAAFVFALHPVQAETVAWIHGGKGALSGLFFMLSTWLFVRADQVASCRTRLGYLGFSLLCFCLAMLSKSSAVTLPVALTLLIWWKHGGSGRRYLPVLAAFFALALVMGFADAMLARRAEQADSGLSLVQRGFLVSRSLCFYLAQLFLPLRLATVYPRWNLDSLTWTWWLFPAAVATVTTVCVAMARRGFRGPAAAMLWFVAAHAPSLGFIDFQFMRHSFVADRFQYLPCIGPIVLVCAGLATSATCGRSSQHARPLQRVAAIGAIFVLAMLTWRQAGYYHSLETLFRHTIALNPAAAVAYNNLGTALARGGNADEAARVFERALEIDPAYPEAHNNLGLLKAREGDTSGAVHHYRLALQAGAPWTKTVNDLAWHLATCPDAGVRSSTESLQLARQAAARSGHRDPAILDTLAAALAESGRFDEAMRTARVAIEIARQNGRKQLANEIAERLQTYSRQQPWREKPETPQTTP